MSPCCTPSCCRLAELSSMSPKPETSPLAVSCSTQAHKRGGGVEGRWAVSQGRQSGPSERADGSTQRCGCGMHPFVALLNQIRHVITEAGVAARQSVATVVAAAPSRQAAPAPTSCGFLDSSMSSSGTPSFCWMASFRPDRLAPSSTSMRSRPSLQGRRGGQQEVAAKSWRQGAGRRWRCRRWQRGGREAASGGAGGRAVGAPGPQPDEHGPVSRPRRPCLPHNSRRADRRLDWADRWTVLPNADEVWCADERSSARWLEHLVRRARAAFCSAAGQTSNCKFQLRRLSTRFCV
jgi:hypothetical protein